MSLLNNFSESVRSQVDRKSLVPSEWMCKNFRHPKSDRANWSFIDHEFQIEIANQGDEVQSVDVEKCAQIGLSTLQINWTLTFCAQHDYHKIAYVLPTAKFATEFSAMRVDVAIDSSPIVFSLVSNDTDNTGMKKIGSCFLVMRGTSGENQGISVDLDAMVIDEYNFCNQKILSTMSSRMQHSLLKLSRNFSTPTLPKYGISARVDESSDALRAVKCDHCSTWVFPSFFNDVVIPGFDKGVAEYRKGDHHHPGVAKSYLACPSCRKELTIANLNDPAKREWVHKHPDRAARGYRVKPWDVPRYNPIPEVLFSIKDYVYQDWNNFRLGHGYESAENSFLLDVVARNSIVNFVGLANLLSGRSGHYGLYIGSDLGKTNHLMVGAAAPFGTLDILCVATVDIAYLQGLYGEVNYGKFLFDLFIAIMGTRIIVDHAPAWETALYLVSKLAEGQAYGAYYVQAQKGNLDILKFDDKKGSVNITRTALFDDVVAASNAGRIRYPVGSYEMATVLKHLGVMKKVRKINAKGVAEENWESTSDEDHYAHALAYLWAAYSSVEGRFTIAPIPMPPMAAGVSMK